MRDITA